MNRFSQTLDTLNEAVFYGTPTAGTVRTSAAATIAARQLRSGPHAGLLAPDEADYAAGIRLFTGERLHTRLGPRNVLSCEAGRLILLLGLPVPGLEAVLDRLQRRLTDECFAAQYCLVGECAHSGLGFMRYLAAGGAADAERRLNTHIKIINTHRNSKGTWLRLPPSYTLLTLNEIDLPAARAELRYAAPALERSLKRPAASEAPYDRRRRDLAERILAKC